MHRDPHLGGEAHAVQPPLQFVNAALVALVLGGRVRRRRLLLGNDGRGCGSAARHFSGVGGQPRRLCIRHCHIPRQARLGLQQLVLRPRCTQRVTL